MSEAVDWSTISLGCAKLVDPLAYFGCVSQSPAESHPGQGPLDPQSGVCFPMLLCSVQRFGPPLRQKLDQA